MQAIVLTLSHPGIPLRLPTLCNSSVVSRGPHPSFPTNCAAFLMEVVSTTASGTSEPTTCNDLLGFWTKYGPPLDPKNHPLNQPQILEGLNWAEIAFGKTLQKLQRICASHRILPSSHLISNDHLRIDEYPFASGGYTDAYIGTLGGSKVCVEKLRVAAASSSDRVEKESDLCKSCWSGTQSYNNASYRCFTERPLCGNS